MQCVLSGLRSRINWRDLWKSKYQHISYNPGNAEFEEERENCLRGHVTRHLLMFFLFFSKGCNSGTSYLQRSPCVSLTSYNIWNEICSTITRAFRVTGHSHTRNTPTFINTTHSLFFQFFPFNPLLYRYT